MPYSVQLKTAK